jgi:putative transposase
MVLAGGEFTEINTENGMLIIDQLVDKFWWLCPMRELILDHGSEFGAHKIHDDGSWNRNAIIFWDLFRDDEVKLAKRL